MLNHCPRTTRELLFPSRFPRDRSENISSIFFVFGFGAQTATNATRSYLYNTHKHQKILYRNHILSRFRRFIQRFIYFFNKIKFQCDSFNKIFSLKSCVSRIFFFFFSQHQSFVSICDEHTSNVKFIKFLSTTTLHLYLSFKFINNV